jgi:hypothetical protein
MNLTKGVAAGLVAAGATMVVTQLFTPAQALIFFAVLLGLIAGVYIGFVMPSGNLPVIVTESVAALAFVGLATAAPFATHGIGLLAVAYFLHAAWDLGHHPGPLGGPPHWYAVSCVAYDVAIGAFILLAYP